LPKLRAVLGGLQRPEISPELTVVLIDFIELKNGMLAAAGQPDPSWLRWNDFLEGGDAAPAEIDFYQAPFDHPLWILFSSGTTGNVSRVASARRWRR
jgi:acetoacetyl-CoA synthetase